MKKVKVEDKIKCEKCKKMVDKPDCILLDKVLRTFICRKCYNNDNEIDDEYDDEDLEMAG